jgi:hypothetical protein
MLLTAIAYSLPMAIGIALSPLPFAAVVTILLSERPANSPAFLLGWIMGILAIGGVVFLIPGLDTARGEPTPLSGWVKLILGGILLVYALWRWYQRSSDSEPVEAPKVLTSMDSISASRTVVTGFLLSVFNPKNLVLTFAGAATIDASMATPLQQGIALIIFASVSSLSVIVPIIGYTLFTAQAKILLIRCKEWLIRNNVRVMAVLMFVFGALIIGSGLRILLA